MNASSLTCRRLAYVKSPTPATHIWINDEILDNALRRFTASSRCTKRYGSNVPGPLEAQRRLAKRRMVGLAGAQAPPGPHVGILFGSAPRSEQDFRWEPPGLRDVTRHEHPKPTWQPVPPWLSDFGMPPPAPTATSETAGGDPASYRQQLAECEDARTVEGLRHMLDDDTDMVDFSKKAFQAILRNGSRESTLLRATEFLLHPNLNLPEARNLVSLLGHFQTMNPGTPIAEHKGLRKSITDVFVIGMSTPSEILQVLTHFSEAKQSVHTRLDSLQLHTDLLVEFWNALIRCRTQPVVPTTITYFTEEIAQLRKLGFHKMTDAFLRRKNLDLLSRAIEEKITVQHATRSIQMIQVSRKDLQNALEASEAPLAQLWQEMCVIIWPLQVAKDAKLVDVAESWLRCRFSAHISTKKEDHLLTAKPTSMRLLVDKALLGYYSASTLKDARMATISTIKAIGKLRTGPKSPSKVQLLCDWLKLIEQSRHLSGPEAFKSVVDLAFTGFEEQATTPESFPAPVLKSIASRLDFDVSQRANAPLLNESYIGFIGDATMCSLLLEYLLPGFHAQESDQPKKFRPFQARPVLAQFYHLRKDADFAADPFACLIIALARTFQPYKIALKEILCLVRLKYGPQGLLETTRLLRQARVAVPATPVLHAVARFSESLPVVAHELHKARNVWLSCTPSLIKALIVEDSTSLGNVFRLLKNGDPHNTTEMIDRLDRHNRLHTDRVALVHEMAEIFAKREQKSNREAFRAVHMCYRFLSDRHAPIGPGITKALVHAGIVRPLAQGEPNSVERCKWILSMIRRIEGPEVADEVDELAFEWGQQVQRGGRDLDTRRLYGAVDRARARMGNRAARQVAAVQDDSSGSQAAKIASKQMEQNHACKTLAMERASKITVRRTRYWRADQDRKRRASVARESGRRTRGKLVTYTCD